MSGSALHVGLIGYGLAGRVFHVPLIRRVPGLELTGVVSRDPERVHRDLPGIGVFDRPEALFADPQLDLVVIATPNHTHAPLAAAALAAGKHVLVDKPFALSSLEARSLLDAARRAGRIACAFQNRRFDADFLTLREQHARGALGEIVEWHSHFDRHRPAVPDRWRDRPGPGAGLWWDLGPHGVDQALCLLGRPTSVSADIATQRDGGGAEDWFHVVLRYARARVLLHGGSLVSANAPRFTVHGTRASFLSRGFDPQEASLRQGRLPQVQDWDRATARFELCTQEEGGVRCEPVAGRRGDWPRLYAELRDCLRHGTPAPVSPGDMLSVMEVMEAAIESATRGRVVTLAPAP